MDEDVIVIGLVIALALDSAVRLHGHPVPPTGDPWSVDKLRWGLLKRPQGMSRRQ